MSGLAPDAAGRNGSHGECCQEEDENEQLKEVGDQRRTVAVGGRRWLPGPALGGSLGLPAHDDGIGGGRIRGG